MFYNQFGIVNEKPYNNLLINNNNLYNPFNNYQQINNYKAENIVNYQPSQFVNINYPNLQNYNNKFNTIVNDNKVIGNSNQIYNQIYNQNNNLNNNLNNYGNSNINYTNNNLNNFQCYNNNIPINNNIKYQNYQIVPKIKIITGNNNFVNENNSPISYNKNLYHKKNLISDDLKNYKANYPITIEINKNLINSRSCYFNKDNLYSNHFNRNNTKNETIKNDILPKGIPNVGLTCYMNSTIQCLFHIKELSESILNNKNIDLNKSSLIYSFKKIIKNLSTDDYNQVNNKLNNYNALHIRSDNLKVDINQYEFIDSIKEFKIKLEKEPLFKCFEAADAKDLTIYLLENMHQEINSRKDVMIPSDYTLDQGNQFSVLNYICNKFTSENDSIFSELFYGFVKYTYHCEECGQVTYNFQYNNFIEIPVKKVYDNINNNIYNCYNNYNNYNMNNMNYNQYNRINRINILDFFKINQKLQITDSNNKMFCNKNCKRPTITTSIERFYLFPNVLLLFLNYGKNISFKCKVDFEEIIDLKDFAESEISPKKFKLIGVICHRGESGSSGHYVSYCRHFDSCWYCFNDSHTSKVSSFRDSQKEGELPYVLFYEKLEIVNY